MNKVAKIEPVAPPSPWEMEQAYAVLVSVRRALLEQDPDIEADERLFSDMLESESGDALAVLDTVVRASIAAASMAGEAKARAERLMDRSRRYQACEARLRAAAWGVLQALARNKLARPDFTLSLSPGRPSVVITDVDEVPEEYTVTTRAPNKSLIAKALGAQIEVPGCELSVPSPTLTIRTR